MTDRIQTPKHEGMVTIVTDKHIADIDQIARDIYSFAAQKISSFIEDEQGRREQYPIDAQRASIYLLGNAIAALDQSVQDECIKVQNKHLRSVINTIRHMTPTSKGPLN